MTVGSVLTRRRMNGTDQRLEPAGGRGVACIRSMGRAKSLRKVLLRAQVAGIEELEDAPQLGEAVFDRRAGQGERATRRGSLRAAWACLVAGFLMFCASSRITSPQCTWPRCFSSRCKQGIGADDQVVLPGLLGQGSPFCV